ncbi:MAG: trypsin-like peptidase domain-containing protein [Phycisphaeraceae bacterium]|nr:trypsin-like peptidase domain-containing protein [Phycisphaeraceae bacterium]
MIRACLGLVLLAVVALCGGCTITGLEETAQRVNWPVDATTAFGCTPVGVDFFGANVRGSGSGVFVSAQWLLTASHAVPEGTNFAWVWMGPGPHSGVLVRVELVLRGGGEPVEAGDWALVRFSESVRRLGAMPGQLGGKIGEDSGVLVVGFPTSDRPDPGAHSARDAVALWSALPRAEGLDRGEGPVRYLRMVRGWSRLGGASGGPVIVEGPDGQPRVAGLLLGRIEYRGLWRRGRAIVVHDVPPQAYLAASGALDDLPLGLGGRGVLVQETGWPGDGATLASDGDGIPQRQAASRR